ncbi:hypothetical protein HQQ80_06100 [Microbacteriaceae bacterium VKM Ac-2855]|nr:hypothetical protein [Microbacteriaceae bacterium VKM Ac-2855]
MSRGVGWLALRSFAPILLTAEVAKFPDCGDVAAACQPYQSGDFNLETFVLTPGQSDILRGTYTREFIDKNVIAVAVLAPETLSPGRIEAAMASMAASHPALRSVLTDVGSASTCRQLFEDNAAALGRAGLIYAEADPEFLQAQMTAQVGRMAERLDAAAGATWGIVRLRVGPQDHLLFVFNHMVADFLAASQFIRTFIRAYARGSSEVVVTDTYLDYLRDLEAASVAEPDRDVRWWHERPWGSVPALADDSASAGNGTPIRRLDVLDEREIAGERLTEGALIDLLEESLREVAGVEVTRVDSAVHGRRSRVERLAGGWISHAVPHIRTASDVRVDAETAKKRAASWPAALPAVRRRADLSVHDHFRAHAFVNFFGSTDPQRWIVEGFQMSAVQSRYEMPARASLTPIRLVVRKSQGRWSLVWTLDSDFPRTDIPQLVATRVVETLTQRFAA